VSVTGRRSCLTSVLSFPPRGPPAPWRDGAGGARLAAQADRVVNQSLADPLVVKGVSMEQ
jgi:hypothetical protein